MVAMESLGNLNVGWGICGFTSSFYAMHEQSGGEHGALVNAHKAYSVLAEIKTYLNLLQAAGENKKLSDIVKFTQSFGGAFKTFTIENYIKLIDGAVTRSETDITKDANFGIAMPPDCVADYLQRMWDLSSTVVKGNASGRAIIGVRNKFRPDLTLHDGLSHYLYRDRSNMIHSWGKTFASIGATKVKDERDYEVIWTISIK